MPNAPPNEKPYPTPPSPDDPRLLGPIQRNIPESIPGLIWSKPDFTASDHKIVLMFSIERKKRPGMEMVPCAMCSNDHPKFLEGAVLWSPDGWLRVIGHRCAAKPEHFGASGYDMLKQRKLQDDLDNAALNWLYVTVPAVRPLIAVVEQLRHVIEFIESEQSAFFSKVKELAELLANRVQHHGGSLAVQQELSGARLVAEAVSYSGVGGRASQSRYEDVSFGNLAGQAFLVKPKFKRSRQLEGIIEAFRRVPEGDGEQPILDLIAKGDQQEINVTAGIVLRAMQRALNLAEQCGDAQRFVSAENLSLLERWGQDARNPTRFSIQQLGSDKVTFVLADKSRVNLATARRPLPSLTTLRAIVEAGVTLERLLSKSAIIDAVS